MTTTATTQSMNNAIRDEIKRCIPLADIIGAQVVLMRNGANYKGLCPFHQDVNPSLVVYPHNETYHCYGCGAHGDIFTWKEKTEGMPFADALRWGSARTGIPISLPSQSANVASNGQKTTSPATPTTNTRNTVYEYKIADGSPVLVNGTPVRHMRRDEPGGKKVWWDPPKGVRPSDLPLYGLAELTAAPMETLVVLVEGEKTCKALRDHGFTAVSLAGGASQTNFGTALDALQGRPVILWPDNDDAGEALMRRVGVALQHLASEVRWLQPAMEGVQPKDDAFDYFYRGGTDVMLQSMMHVAPLFVGPTNAENDSAALFEEPSVDAYDGANYAVTPQPPSTKSNDSGSTAVEEVRDGGEACTDGGNGERLRRYFGDRLRYTPESDWYAYNGRAPGK